MPDDILSTPVFMLKSRDPQSNQLVVLATIEAASGEEAISKAKELCLLSSNESEDAGLYEVHCRESGSIHRTKLLAPASQLLPPIEPSTPDPVPDEPGETGKTSKRKRHEKAN